MHRLAPSGESAQANKGNSSSVLWHQAISVGHEFGANVGECLILTPALSGVSPKSVIIGNFLDGRKVE